MDIKTAIEAFTAADTFLARRKAFVDCVFTSSFGEFPDFVRDEKGYAAACKLSMRLEHLFGYNTGLVRLSGAAEVLTAAINAQRPVGRRRNLRYADLRRFAAAGGDMSVLL